MRKALVLAFLAFFALPSLAAEEGASEGKKGGKPGTNVDMQFVMAPLTNTDGKLIGYAYISSRLTAVSEAIVTDVREKLPFIQDRFVRNVNQSSVATADDPKNVDIPALEARFLAEARKVMGAGKVKMITVCTVQISDLHPVQKPVSAPPPGAPQEKAPKSRCES